jgi:hypothetical protein
MSSSVSQHPKMTRAQKRGLESARQILGPDVRAYAAGRAEARLSQGAQWTIGIFGAIFAFVLIVFHLFLIPGGLVIAFLYESIRPPRGVVVTGSGVAELQLNLRNGRPKAVLDTVPYSALESQNVSKQGGKLAMRFNDERVDLKEKDMAFLTGAVPLEFPAPPA